MMIDKQQTFNKVVSHLLKEDEEVKCNSSSLYCTPIGLYCSDCDFYLPLCKMLDDLVEVHDIFPRILWKKELIILTIMYGLDTPKELIGDPNFESISKYLKLATALSTQLSRKYYM